METRPLQVIGVSIGGQPCALPSERILRLVHFTDLATPPGLPPSIGGFLNFRGTAVPVLHTALMFALPEPPAHLYTPIILLQGDSHPLGLIVDSLGRSLRVDDDSRRPVTRKHCFNECVEAEIETPEGTLHLLSIERLLLEEERQRVTQLQAAAQERLAKWETHADR